MCRASEKQNANVVIRSLRLGFWLAFIGLSAWLSFPSLVDWWRLNRAALCVVRNPGWVTQADMQQCLPLLDQAASQSPIAHHRYWFMLTNALASSGEDIASHDVFVPDNWGGHAYQVARQQREQGRLRKAQELFLLAAGELASTQDEDSLKRAVYSYQNAAQIAVEQGNLNQARTLYKQGIMVSARPALGLYLELAEVVRAQGEGVGAVDEEYEHLWLISDRQDVYLLAWPANVLLRLGRPELAYRYLQQAQQKWPSESVIANLWGRYYFAEGQDLMAETSFRRAIAGWAREQPERAAVCANELASLWLRRGQPEKALQAQRQAVQLLPDVADYWYSLGCILEDMGRIERAKGAYQNALNLQPSHDQARRALAHLEQ